MQGHEGIGKDASAEDKWTKGRLREGEHSPVTGQSDR